MRLQQQEHERRPQFPASAGILLMSALVGISFFTYYFRLGLTVAHYDAKAHLVVARRMIDAIVPGYAQMGANWLPLLHILYLPFMLFDAQYRSGFVPSLISVGAFIVADWLVFRIALRASGSTVTGIFAAILLMSNANLQYLQSCPMTEPVFMALMLLAADGLQCWRESEESTLPWGASTWAALASMCRYEGWYFIGGMLLLMAYDFQAQRLPRSKVIKGAALSAVMFLAVALAHFGYIHARLGSDFIQRVVEGNPAPYETYKRPFLSALYHLAELGQIAGIIPLVLGLSGLGYCILQRRRFAQNSSLLLLWLPSLINVSALYWGLMYRVRYSILLLPALAVFASLVSASTRLTRFLFIVCATTAMLLPWVSWYFPHEWRYHLLAPGPGVIFFPAAALVLFLWAAARNSYYWPLLALCVVGSQVPILKFEDRPMLAETGEHAYIEPERQEVLNYLRAHYDGTRILIDMGRLAPLVYDSGLNIREFVYNEGDLSPWQRAMLRPDLAVGWLCTENGDAIWRLLQVDPRWGDLYSLAVQTEHYRVYHFRWERERLALPSRIIE